MKILSITELNLSEQANKFISDFIGLLNKPLQIIELPDDYPNFACVSPNPVFYAIGIRTNINKTDLEANLCHELYHAYQISIGFPTVKGYAPDTSKFCENLRSTILDLSDNEVIKAYGLNYDNVIRTRYRQCKRYCETSFREINNPFAKDLFTIDLILDLSDFPHIQQKKILKKLSACLPDVYSKYNTYHNVIFEQYDYHTKEGCLNIFAYIFDDIGLWQNCSINYLGQDIRTKQEFEQLNNLPI